MKRKYFDRFTALMLCTCFQISAFALSLADPIAFVASSSGARFVARVEPGEAKNGGRKATAQVFEYDEKTKSYERGRLLHLENQVLPGELLITEDGSRLVGVDDWWNFEYENPVIIVYDEKGKVLKRFRIEDFLTKEEVAAVKKKRGGVPDRWVEDVVLAPGALELRVIRDKVLSGPNKKHDNFLVDLRTMKIRKWDLGAKIENTDEK